MSTSTLVTLKKATMKYLDKSLDLEIRSNDLILLTGKNGCGKSTFIKLILGFIKPTIGSVISNIKSISYLPEILSLPETLKVIEYVELIERIKKVENNDKWLLRLGIPLFKKIGHLSKGNRQKLGLYSTLIGQEPLVVLDEPLSGLDERMKWIAVDMIYEKSKTAAVIVSTHEKKLFDRYKFKEIDLND